MNQILDHSGPKKVKARKNPEDTQKIIRVYAILIIIFAICFIGKARYSIVENNKIINSSYAGQNQGPQITINANEDILSIQVTYSEAIESVAYQWYRENVTADEIDQYESSVSNSSDSTDEQDDELQNDDEIKALGHFDPVKGNGGNQMKLDNIGIPKGNNTILVTVITRNNVITKYIQSYSTDIGVDKIKPEINVKVQGKNLIVTAVDETEISKLIYSINGAAETEITDRTDSKTIKATIPLSDAEENNIIISAVDKANNTGAYNKKIDLYAGTPKISFTAESDFSKIYANISYSKGIKRIEYEFNGESFEKEFDNPEDVKEYELELKCIEGKNTIKVKAYATQEEVYTEDSGECEYVKQ